VVAATPAATAAAGWLSGELTAGTNQLSNGPTADWGLTTDAVLALVGVNGSTDPVASAAVTNLLAHITDYTTLDTPGVLLAGPIAKSLLAAEAVGKASDPVAVTLESQLRSLLAASGRFSDLNPNIDSSNGFGQADAILALARTASGVPSGAVDFLISQQCPDGGFRLVYSDGSCTDSSQADTDATAMAVQALFTVDRTPAVANSLSLAVGWLESIQDPTTGSFSGTGPTASPNANSTGLIAEALRGAGDSADADRAAAWITSLQLVAPSTSAGAIAYDPDGFTAASNGIVPLSLDQWHRATAQAVLADGVAPLGSIGAGGGPLPDPVTPGTSTSTSTASTTTSTSSTTTTTVPPSTTTTSTTSGTATTTTTSSTGSGSSTTGGSQSSTGAKSGGSVPVQVLGDSEQRVNFAAALGSSGSSSSSRSSSSNPLAHTGTDDGPFVGLGLMAFFLGLAAMFAVRFGDWPA
jgi:hypothetical protein